MARIQTYNIDDKIDGDERLIGSDSNTNQTKNFVLSDIADWMNSSNVIGIAGQINFLFQTDSITEIGRGNGTISFTNYGGDNTNFSDITTIVFSGSKSDGTDVSSYLQTFVSNIVILFDINNVSNFGTYTLEYFTQIGSSNFYEATLAVNSSNGSLSAGSVYGFSLYQSVTGGGTSGPVSYIQMQSPNNTIYNVYITNDGVFLPVLGTPIPPDILELPTVQHDKTITLYSLNAVTSSVNANPEEESTLQWQISNDGVTNWVDIAGATAVTHNVDLTEFYKYIRIKQTETNFFGVDTAESTGFYTIYSTVLANIFRDRVNSLGGSVESMTCLYNDLDELKPSAPYSQGKLLNNSGLEKPGIALSLELLDKNYLGPCVKAAKLVGTETVLQDIYFNNGVLDSTALLTFANGGDVFVHTWYDQSIHSNHAKTTDISLMPYIVLSGSYLGYIKNRTTASNQSMLSKFSYKPNEEFSSYIVKRVTGSGVGGGTESNTSYYGVAQQGSTLDPQDLSGNGGTPTFNDASSPIQYYSNGSALTNPNRDDLYNEISSDFKLITTLATSQLSLKLMVGYGLAAFNNVLYKEIIVYRDQSVRSQVEKDIKLRYNLA